MRLEAVEERLGLQQAAAALRADEERLRSVGDRFLVRVDDQPRADLLNIAENRIVLDELRFAASFAGELRAEGGLSFGAVKVHPATKLVLRIGPNGCQ